MLPVVVTKLLKIFSESWKQTGLPAAGNNTFFFCCYFYFSEMFYLQNF